MPVVSIGQRVEWVQIQSRPVIDTAGGSGFPTDPWSNMGGKVAMSRRPLGARERFNAQQVSASVDNEWELPYQSTMDPDLVDVPKLRRLVAGNKTYDIVSADVQRFPLPWIIRLTTLARSG